MRASSYAKALQKALLEHPNEEAKLLKHFTGIVKQNGHSYLFPRIIKSFERIREKEEQMTTIEVTSAKEMSEEEIVALLKKEPFKHALSTRHKHVARKIDDTLIGGAIVRTGTARVDGSYKRALQTIYQNFTNSL